MILSEDQTSSNRHSVFAHFQLLASPMHLTVTPALRNCARELTLPALVVCLAIALTLLIF